MLRKPTQCVYSPFDMKVSAFGRAAAIAFLYIAVFVLLVVIQFPTAGPITEVAGGVSFKGLPAQDGKGIRSAEITAAGIRLVFSDRYPLVLLNVAGAEVLAKPVSYKSGLDGFTVRFNDGTSLEVRGAPDGRASWSITPGKPAASATMHYELSYGATMLAAGDNGELRLSAGGSTWQYSGISPADAPRKLKVASTKGVLRPFVASIETEVKPASSAGFIAQAAMDPAVWAKELSDWRDKAWYGLSGPSFNPAAGTWTASAASPGSFDEAAFIAYEAEAILRDKRDAAVALTAVVRTAHAASIGWKSVPFAGKTAAAMAAFEDSNLAEVKTAERLVQERSARLFQKSGIVPMLFDRAPYSLAQEAMALASTLDFSKSDVPQAVALIEAYLDARSYLSEESNPFTKAVDLVDRVIAPAIRKVDSAFYLQTAPDGRCDALAGLSAGKALIRLADALGKPIYAGIGQSLVAGFMRLASDDGSMPASVTTGSGAVVQSENKLSAAAAYPVLADSPYYPRAISFFRQLGPGAWAWTCSPVVRIDTNQERTVLTVDFPAGFSHYMALYGVKPFARIQLYGLDYNMDASFENYNASGYFYKKAAGAMYLKMRHKTQAEDIRLFY